MKANFYAFRTLLLHLVLVTVALLVFNVLNAGAVPENAACSEMGLDFRFNCFGWNYSSKTELRGYNVLVVGNHGIGYEGSGSAIGALGLKGEDSQIHSQSNGENLVRNPFNYTFLRDSGMFSEDFEKIPRFHGKPSREGIALTWRVTAISGK